MITPTKYSFLSPRERMRKMHIDTLALVDRSHLEPVSLLIHCHAVHESIKSFYLGQGHTFEQWQQVSFNLEQFNMVWHEMLGLRRDVVPPPPVWRFVVSPSINQLINQKAKSHEL